MYFTTIRYEFRLTCALCSGEMVVETDPEHRGYKLVSGVKKQTTAADDEQNDNSPEERGVEQLNESHVGHRAAEDPFFRLEHEHHDKEKAKQRARGLEAVVQLQDQQFKDDFKSNAALRATFRKTKHHLQANARRADALGLGIPLLDANEDDIARSKATVFQGIHNKKRKKESDQAGRRDGGNEDPFQFFGEEKASKLHQLKYKKREQNMAKRISGGATATLHKTSVDRVHARAKKLLARR